MTTPVFCPLLPKVDALLPYLRTIDETRWYTNHGPLVRSFENRMASLFGTHVVTSANATLALAQVLSHFRVPASKLCAVPSWTFAGSPAAIRAAGLMPYFIDVEPSSWSLNPVALARHPRLAEFGAVMVVSPFGAPVDMRAWSEFMLDTEIPVVIDAAAAFDAVSQEKGLAEIGCPIVISLHATKTFGIGEGAVVLCRDAATASSVRKFGNFGFETAREATVAGINAKLPEYLAAIGLAAMDSWHESRAEWARLSKMFTQCAATVRGVTLQPGFAGGWVAPYGNVVLPNGVSVERVTRDLNESGIETRRWWSRGCHQQLAYSSCPRDALPTTERLAERVLGLPFWIGLGPSQLDEVFRALEATVRGA